MLTDPKLRSQVDSLWDKFWSGGLNNPLDAIEQFSYLLFLKRLDDRENAGERQAGRRGVKYEQKVPLEMRWGHWTKFEAADMLKHMKEKVFPWFRTLGTENDSFTRYMANAECKISKPSLLVEACNLINQMEISQQNQDVQGDLYEYLLGKLNQAGRNGQFRTPRHIIRMMVQMVDPKPRERIGDLAGGTCGFPVNAHQYILEKHTSPAILEYDAEGLPHHLIGDLLSDAERKFMSSDQYLRAFDNDSGMVMLRIGSMNLMLHGIESPQFFYMDTLSKAFNDERNYDVILMNPPFKGAVDKGDINPTLPGETTKSELLFLHLILRALDMGGRAAVIVPDGVLFGSSRAHVELRKRLIEENRLDGVISMPSGVFKPYAGVSTAVLFFTRGAQAKEIWFYDMAHDGFSLDDKRVRIDENDIPDVIGCWTERFTPDFQSARSSRIAELRQELHPLKEERLELQREIDEMTFVKTLTAALPEPHPYFEYPQLRQRDAFDPADLDVTKNRLTELETQIQPLQAELDRLSRQFWVTKAQVKANKYDLSASRYSQADAEQVYHPETSEALDRLLELNQVINFELLSLKSEINPSFFGRHPSPETEANPDPDSPI
ncbi:MAG: N-6 DNA methylase [Chloroflexi bacterium]|nr:N-6 DNA methylase [Chloroflexota bacterium]